MYIFLTKNYVKLPMISGLGIWSLFSNEVAHKKAGLYHIFCNWNGTIKMWLKLDIYFSYKTY